MTMADDEPLDDLRAVAMAGGTAAARIVETLAREARETRQRDQDRQAALQAEQAQTLVARHAAGGLPSWQPGLAARQEETTERVRHVAGPAAAQAPPGPVGPADRDRSEAVDRREAVDLQKRYGMDRQPGEARDARRLADGMNGADPALAARQAPEGWATGRPSKFSVPLVTCTTDRGR